MVSYGADRDIKNSQGQTPRNLATSAEILYALENTKVIVDLNESIRAAATDKEIVIAVSKAVLKDSNMKKILLEGYQRLGVKKPTIDFLVNTTYLVVDDKEELEPNSYQYLAALVTGSEIVKSSWLLGCYKNFRIVDNEKYSVDFDCADQDGVTKFKDLILTQQPRLFSGIHFYLQGNFGHILTKNEVTNLVKLCDGKVVTREPDPEGIPPEEVSLPHHAEDGSVLSGTSHILLYQDGIDQDPPLQYKMSHIKTLPLSWFVRCIKHGKLLEPTETDSIEF